MTTDELLVDGRHATIRALTETDRPALLALFAAASDENIRFRFFALNRHAGEQYVEQVLAEPPSRRIALVAVVAGQVMALGTAEIVAPGSAEISFLVEDSAHGFGLGTLLLEHLAAVARTRGVTSFTGDVLSDNLLMLEVLREAGFAIRRSTSYGVTTIELSTESTPRAVAAAHARRRRAETHRPAVNLRS